MATNKEDDIEYTVKNSNTNNVVYTGISPSTGITYSNSATNWRWNTLSPAASASTSTSSQLNLQGEHADIKINDISLMKILSKIEERLNILTPNPALEKEWDKLKELGDHYRKLSAEFEEKSRMWKQLRQTE
jgi:hypothetical protein